MRGKKAMIHLLCRLAKSRKGATAVEYGLIVALIVIAMVSMLKELASTTSGMWNNINDKVTSAH